MMQEAQQRGEPVPQIAPESIEAAISQQIGEILKEIMLFVVCTETRPTCRHKTEES